MAEENDSIDIDVEMRGALAAEAKAASAEADKLARNLSQVNRRLKEQKRLLEENAAAMGTYAAAEEAANIAGDKHSKTVDKEEVSVKKFSKRLEESSRVFRTFTKFETKADTFLKKLGKTVVGAGKFLSKFGTFAMTAGKFLGMAGLAGGAAYAIPLLVTLVNELSSLMAFSALIPTVMGGVLTSVLALKVALSGTKAAFQSLTMSTKDFNAEMKKLSPAAKVFFRTLRPFAKQFKEIQRETQNSFFAPLNHGLKTMISNNLPTIRRGLASLAGAWGKAFDNIIKTMGGGTGKSIFSSMFKAGIDMAHAFGRAAGPILKGVAAVMKVMGPNFTKLTQKAGDLGVRFGKWLQKISSNGQLQKWFDKAYTVAIELGKAVKDVVQIFENLGKAAGNAGLGSAIGLLLHGLSILNLFLSSKAGQQATQAFFEALRQIMPVLAPLFGVLAGFIANDLLPNLIKLVVAAAPGMIKFLDALFKALKPILPQLPTLGKQFGEILTQLTPLLPPLSDLVNNLLSGLLGALKTLMPTFSLVVGLFATLVGWLALMPPGLIQALAIAFIALYGAVKILGVFMTILDIAEAIFDTETAIAELELLPLIGVILLVIAAIALLIVGIILIIKYHKQIWTFMKFIWNEIWKFLKMIGHWFAGPFVNFFLHAGSLIAGWAKNVKNWFFDAWNWAKNKVSEAVSWIKKKISEFISKTKAIPGDVKKAWDTIKQHIIDAMKAAWQWVMDKVADIKAKISGIIGDIKGLPGKAAGAVGGLLNKLNPFKAMGGPVNARTKYIVGEIGPEMFVPKVGKPTMIGTHGMEKRSFAQSGTIIPNHMLGMYEKMQAANAKAMAEMASSARRHTGQANVSEHHHHYDVAVRIDGDVHKDVDIERAVRKALDKADRERQSRDTGVRVMGRF